MTMCPPATDDGALHPEYKSRPISCNRNGGRLQAQLEVPLNVGMEIPVALR